MVKTLCTRKYAFNIMRLRRLHPCRNPGRALKFEMRSVQVGLRAVNGAWVLGGARQGASEGQTSTHVTRGVVGEGVCVVDHVHRACGPAGGEATASEGRVSTRAATGGGAAAEVASAVQDVDVRTGLTVVMV